MFTLPTYIENKLNDYKNSLKITKQNSNFKELNFYMILRNWRSQFKIIIFLEVATLIYINSILYKYPTNFYWNNPYKYNNNGNTKS